MRSTFLIFTVLCLMKTSTAQTFGVQDTSSLKVERIQSIHGRYTDHYIDAFSQLYTITPSGQMRKSAIGDTTALIYNELKKMGKPTNVDASNPLRTVVFFKSYAWIAILDKLLTPRNAFSLRKYDLFNITAAANAYDNALWLFDARNMQLLKMDESGNVLLRSADLRNLGVDLPNEPVNLFEFEQQVFLFDRTNGLYGFDRYGAFQNHYPTDQFAFIGLCKEGILLRNHELVRIFNPAKPSLNNFFFRLPKEVAQMENLKICNDMLSVLSQTGIDIYKLK